MNDGTAIKHKQTSGLCTQNGKEWPAGARVSELVWSSSGMRSGAMAWDLSKVSVDRLIQVNDRGRASL
jgi:hypothetical protein